MKFDSASKVEMVVWDMRLADLPRSAARVILDRLYNGNPPWDESTAEENGVQINRNFLEGPNMLARSRRQFDTAALQGGIFFPITVDSGPVYKRRDFGSIITKNLNRPLKESSIYLEKIQGENAQTVLHGIAPAVWKNKKCPLPSGRDIGSVLIPSETLRSFENLDRFAIYHEFTPSQLWDLTHGPRVDPGWNLPLVNKKLKEIATEYRKNYNITAYQYDPERIEELIKQDKGFWGTDAVPTIDCWEFYFREAEDGDGWYRRIILDWGVGSGAGNEMPEGTNRGPDGKDYFLFTSGKRKYANKLSEIMQCQFGDASAVAPFRYHSVRSLGWMLWGVCDIMNRLRCRFTESVFEQLMWFFRTSSAQTFERLKKANFNHMGVIPEGIAFVGAQERFKPDAGLIEMAMEGNRQLISENSAGFTPSLGTDDKDVKATAIIARENSSNAMATGMLTSIYARRKMEGMEIARRFCIKDSQEPMVKEFRKRCLKEGVPEELLDSERWNVDVERVMGGGNKTLEVAQANALMELVPHLDPDAQQEVIHINIEAKTSDAALADRLVPLGSVKQVSDATHDAQLALGSLMMGFQVSIKRGMNHIDYVEALLHGMTLEISKIEKGGGMATADQIVGLNNLAQHIGQHLKIIAQVDEEKQRVKQYSDDLGKMMNLVRAYQQRLQEQQQKQAQQNGNGGDPETAAKLQGKLMIDQAKAQNMRESHGARTAQKQIQWEAGEKRKEQEHNITMRRKLQEQRVDDTLETLKTAAEIKNNRMRSMSNDDN